MNLLEKKQYVDENIGKLPEVEINDFKSNFECVFTKRSCSMEGNLISLAKVIQIIKGRGTGLESDIARSAFNHYQAYKMVEERALKNEPLTEEFVKDVHAKLLDGMTIGGLYRNVDIKINGSEHTPCSYLKVRDRMDKFFYDIEHFEGTDLELAAYTHLQIAKIHPFLDGNGRLARLLLNYQLIRLGYLPVTFTVKLRQDYFNTLEAFKVQKTSAPFMDLLEKRLTREYDRITEVIERY